MNTMQILMGSNLNASANMAEAYDRLRLAFPVDIRFSSEVSSKTINKAGDEVPDGSHYLNVLCMAHTPLPVEKVIEVLKAIEKEMGRVKGSSEVAIDLDLVVWNHEIHRPWDTAQVFYQDCLRNIKETQSLEG